MVKLYLINVLVSLDVDKVAVPATNNVTVLLSIFQVATFKCIDLALEVSKIFLFKHRFTDFYYETVSKHNEKIIQLQKAMKNIYNVHK